MEDLLLNLAKEANTFKYPAVQKLLMDAYALMECQQCTRDPAYVLREKCFIALKGVIETKRNKLISQSINGIYKMIKDDRFQSNYEPEDDSLWFPSQLLHTFSSIQNQSDDVQVDMLKVLLYVACSPCWTVNGRIVIQIITTCSEIYESGTQATRSASQAACSQILSSFCHFLDEECQEMDMSQESSSGILCFNEVIPILQFICCKVDEIQCTDKYVPNVAFFLECLHTLTSNLPQKIHTNRHFTTFLWQKLCPALIAFLGCPKVDKKIISRDERRNGDSCNAEIGRGSGILATALSFDSYQAKTIYSIGNQLVRLVGCVSSLRPVLESIYHRMLLYPPPQHRLEALKALKEVLRSSDRLADFTGPILVEDDRQQFCQQNDMALTRLIMDSIEESSAYDSVEILHACLCCISSLLNTLLDLSNGKGINDKYVEKINLLFSSLSQCDYTGPLTYDSVTRLPHNYREIIKYKVTPDDEDCRRSRTSSGHSSGDTEGPEEGFQSVDSDVEEALLEEEKQKANEESVRLNKVRKASDLTESIVLEQIGKSLDAERENARYFAKSLLSFLPSLFQLRSTLQVDEALQEFASKYCQSVTDSHLTTGHQITIINADGIYLATYAALKFNLKLIHNRYYNSAENVPLTFTEDQFVEEVHGSGVLVYLAASWLSELYQQVLVTNFLQLSGYNPPTNKPNEIEIDEYLPVINLLSDIDGDLNPYDNRLLSDYQRLERAATRPLITSEIEAGRKVSRRVLTCCWDSMVKVLSVALQNTSNKCNSGRSHLKSFGKSKSQDILIRECLEITLESLQKAAELTNILAIQNRCGTIFALLVNAACPETNSRFKDTSASSSFMTHSKPKLYTSQVLSMDVILKKGLNFGSYAPDCWRHIFRCASYVCQLEQKWFRHMNASVMPVGANSSSSLKGFANSSPEKCNSDSLKSAFEPNELDDDEIMDVYSFLATSPSPTVSVKEQTILDVIEENKSEWSRGVLSDVWATRIVCILSQHVDSLFEEASLKLNLEALVSFVRDLCSVSHDQLFQRSPTAATATTVKKNQKKDWWNIRNITKSANVKLDHALFLSRINQVVLKCIRSGRPLFHIMKVWSIAGPHYIEAACSKEQAVSKIAITCMHDAITALLNEQAELPHFHFNEALFKPFEILLCLELCDSDIQDQIVSCICEFVEGNSGDIRSGWRSLFGGLKVISSAHLASLLDVFRVFLDTDNTLVFSNAAIDFVSCLLRHVRGSTTEELITVEDNSTQQRHIENENGLKLSNEALKCLQQCVAILSSMYNMQTCPTFHSAHNVRIGMSLVEPTAIETEFYVYGVKEVDTPVFQLPYNPLSSSSSSSKSSNLHLDAPTLYSLDKPSGVLKVWAFMIENLVFTVISAVGEYQTSALDTLFAMLKDLVNVPGIDFSLFCVNHMVLPSVQHWLQKLTSCGPNSDHQATALTNFKQCCGTLTDLIAYYFQHLNDNKCVQKGSLVLKQLILLLIELIASSKEMIARLGCACLRHIILSSGPVLNCEQWNIVCFGLYRSCVLSLYPLRQLMAAFYTYSQSFYGDIAQVKVAARKDSTAEETYRVKQLSQQIFLLESQYDEYRQSNGYDRSEEERSYILLLCPKDEDSQVNGLGADVIRIPYKSILIGLLAHQLLLQIIATLLIQGSPHTVPSLANVLLQTPTTTAQSSSKQRTTSASSNASRKLFGMTDYMNEAQIRTLFGCLDYSYEKAVLFDSRPGLKFLMQKVAGLEKAANLYRQAGASCTLKIVTLFELYLYEIRSLDVTLKTVKEHVENYEYLYENYEQHFLDNLLYEQTDTFIVYLFNLKRTFDKLCDKYVDVVVDKDGLYSVIDSVYDQPIFFLIPQPQEDFSSTAANDAAGGNSGGTSSSDSRLIDGNRFYDDNRNIDDCVVANEKSIIDELNGEVKDSSSSDQVVDEIPGKSDFPGECHHRGFTVIDEKDVVEQEEEEKETNKKVEDETAESVYMMATSKSIHSVVEEYTKRKKSFSMLPPLNLSTNQRKNPAIVNNDRYPHKVTEEPLPPEIEQQRKTSIHKDSEVHLAVWAEVLMSVFDLLAQLKDDEFRLLLPVLFNGVRKLTVHATHTSLKHALAEFFHRVAIVYGFSP